MSNVTPRFRKVSPGDTVEPPTDNGRQLTDAVYDEQSQMSWVFSAFSLRRLDVIQSTISVMQRKSRVADVDCGPIGRLTADVELCRQRMSECDEMSLCNQRHIRCVEEKQQGLRTDPAERRTSCSFALYCVMCL